MRILSDRQYEALFFSLLEIVESPEQVRARLGDRQRDRSFLSWLRRFGQTQLQNSANHEALAQQMVALAAVDLGVLSNLAGEIGEQLLAKAAEPPEEMPPADESSPSESANGENLLAAEQDERATFYHHQGKEAFYRGDFEGAITACNHALRFKPNWYEALSSKGASLGELGQYEKALTSYDNALRFKPDFHKALTGKGISLDKLERCEEAITAYDDALRFKPDYHEAPYNKGVSLDNLGRYEEALTAYDQALTVKPDYHEALYNKGISLCNLGRYEEALTAYDDALRFKPDYHEAPYNKGVSLDNLGRYEEALTAYDQALTVKPDYHKALTNKGNSLCNLGRYEEAITACGQALTVKPDDHKALTNKGNSLDKLGRYEEAIAAYDQALTIKPDWHGAWINRGIAASSSVRCNTPVVFSLPISLQDQSLDQRGYEGQIACYTIGLKHVQESENLEGWGELYRQKGRAHYFHGRFRPDAQHYLEESINAYKEALTALPAFPTSHLAVLQDAIRAYLGLSTKPAKASEYRRQGLEVFHQLLNDASTPTQKQRLEQKFSGFSQIQVDSLIREGNPTQALQTAERYKNCTLGWILDTWKEQITIPSWADMQTLLTPTTAAIYWHLSPDNLTTFLLTAEATEPQVISVVPADELKNWVKAWQQRYQTYRKKSKSEEGAAVERDRPNHPWRLSLRSDLQKLQEILNIPQLEASLSHCTHLLLVPHRELHLLPLHALFSKPFITTYLPSCQTGLTLKQKQTSQPAPEQFPALLLETPENDELESLVFAEVETALVAHLCTQQGQSPAIVGSSQAHTATVVAALNHPHRLFHFTGHGAHDYRQPKKSALALTGTESLSAGEIVKLDLQPYDLVTLAACETAAVGQADPHTDYVGLASAFLAAGSTQVISTLWTVDSQSNAWLMVQFYQRYLTGTPAPLALHQAQHWLRTATYSALADWLESLNTQAFRQSCTSDEDETLLDTIGKLRQESATVKATHTPYADPYYWAAFTLTGYCHES